jgi:F0F1-type ATP synthase delta subunit
MNGVEVAQVTTIHPWMALEAKVLAKIATLSDKKSIENHVDASIIGGLF